MKWRRFATFVTHHSKLLMAIYVAITAVFVAFVGAVEVRTSIRDFLPSETKTIEDFDRLFSDFGGNPTLSVVIEAEDVYQPEVLSRVIRVAHAWSILFHLGQLLADRLQSTTSSSRARCLK